MLVHTAGYIRNEMLCYPNSMYLFSWGIQLLVFFEDSAPGTLPSVSNLRVL